MTQILLEALVKIALLIGGLMTAAAYLVLLERKLCAWIQDRLGPNRVGIPLTKIGMFGLGQPLADGVKFIMKEEYTPAHVNRGMYILAPISILAAALAIFAVIPFGSALPTNFGFESLTEQIQLVVVPGFDSALIFVFAMSSVSVYGVILGGWASNNKYSFLGGLRSSAQLIAYELPMGMGILGVVLAAHSLNLEKIIVQQANGGWFLFTQPLGFVVFMIAAFAEAARLPFDLPECEQELVGGYHTEYAGLKLLMFLVAEFLHMITASALIAILFLGGWHFWGLTGTSAEVANWGEAVLRVLVLVAKMFLVILFFMIVRWSWPRFRFDQLMALGWKIMLPLGMVNFVAIAAFDQLRHSFQLGDGANWVFAAVSWGICVLSLVVVGVSGTVVTDNRPRNSLTDAETV